MTKKILVIDDNKLIALTLKRMLTIEGFKVITALSGKIALKRIEEGDFDLVISDIKMSEMDGIETLRKMKEKES